MVACLWVDTRCIPCPKFPFVCYHVGYFISIIGEQLEYDDSQVVAAVRHWVESLVIGLNLCPFAKRELVKDRVRFSVAKASTEESLLQALELELEMLNDNADIETTLLIHPLMLQDFEDYNQFLNYSDALLQQMGLDGVYQIASFHPDYQFGGTEVDDVENYTNRSPYPILHLLREESLERAIEDYPDVGEIPSQNIALMESLGVERLKILLGACANVVNSGSIQ